MEIKYGKNLSQAQGKEPDALKKLKSIKKFNIKGITTYKFVGTYPSVTCRGKKLIDLVFKMEKTAIRGDIELFQ